MPKKAKTRTTQEDVLYRLKRAQGLLEQAVKDIERGDRVDALDALRLHELHVDYAKHTVLESLPAGMRPGPVRSEVTQRMVDRMRVAMISELKRKNPDMDTTQNEEDRIETNEAMQRVLEAVLNG